jgi:WD40 repeat protein
VILYLPEVKKRKDTTQGHLFIEEEIIWKQYTIIDENFEVLALSWGPKGNSLLLGGSFLALYSILLPNSDHEEDVPKDEEGNPKLYQVKWRTETSSRVSKCSISPDGAFFVSLSAYDRLPKLWHTYSPSLSSNPQRDYRFIYLPHPAAVVSLMWRKHSNSSSTREQNVLMTICRNNIVRLWMEHSPTSSSSSTQSASSSTAVLNDYSQDRFQFTVCAVVEPGIESVADWIRPAPSLCPAAVLNTTHTNYDKDNNNNNNITDSKPRPSTARNIFMLQQRVLTQVAIAALDWIVSAQKTGMVIIWKIKGIGETPKRTPNCSIWSRFTLHTPQPTPYL